MSKDKVKLTPQQKQAFSSFLEYTNARRLSRNLRNMLLLYLMHEQDSIPAEMNDLLYDLTGLFRLLDEVGSE